VAKLAAAAAAARDAGRLDEALDLYRRALAQAPAWQEGWWQVGAIHYGRDQYPPCRDAFRRFTALNPTLSAGFAFLGLCEFQVKEFPSSVKHLEKAVQLGLPPGEQLSDVAIYHLALLHTRGANFERALQFCVLLQKRPSPDPTLPALAGIAALRRPIFPHELPEADRDLAYRLGSAVLSAGAKPPEEVMAQFDEIIRLYPKAASVHYSYATFLLVNDPERGLEELRKELEISPNHVPALVSLAFEYLRRGEPDKAKAPATKAVSIAPGSFAARACLGRVLMESGDSELAAATRELEAAVKLAPDSPQAHFSLAAAYARAGRKDAAARERAEFARLKKIVDAAGESLK
jgi:tetratricopeptide (TPR) repeat protein